MQTITEGEAARDGLRTPYFEAAETPFALTPGDGLRTPAIEMTPASRVVSGASAMNSAGSAAQRARGLRRFKSGTSVARRSANDDEYENDVVDLLDLVGMSAIPRTQQEPH